MMPASFPDPSHRSELLGRHFAINREQSTLRKLRLRLLPRGSCFSPCLLRTGPEERARDDIGNCVGRSFGPRWIRNLRMRVRKTKHSTLTSANYLTGQSAVPRIQVGEPPNPRAKFLHLKVLSELC